VKCADGIQCIGEWEMCNGDTKCNDESDEIPDVCKGNKRNKYVNGKYIKGIKHIIVLQLFKLVSFNPTHVGVYSLQHYVIKFVSDLRQVGGFLLVLLYQ
jgi:hypothetical protein